MTTKALQGFDFTKILEAAIDARGVSEWHQESDDDPDKPFSWHASALGGCPRAQILKRAGLAIDGLTLKSKLNFEVGHIVHGLFENGAAVYKDIEPDFELVASEFGARHETLNLAAKCDSLVRWQGDLVLLELKTEHELAAKRRKEDAAERGAISSARPEHALQATATAMCLEPHFGPIEQARICYVSKNNLWTDQQPIALNQELRTEVTRRVQILDAMWEAYKRDQSLPAKLSHPKEVWMCSPRSTSDPKGKWCQSRTACMGLR